MENSEPSINLKQHQRFKRQIPWGLIRKLVIVGMMGGMFYYLMNGLQDNKKSVESTKDYQIEVETVE